MSPPPRTAKRTLPDGTRRGPAAARAIRRDATSLRDALDRILSGRAPSDPDDGSGGEPELFGTSTEMVLAVAHVVRRAHEALHDGTGVAEPKQTRCAQVLFVGLPEGVSRKLILADAVEQVRFLARESNPDRAVPMATAALLGWTEIATRAVATVVADTIAEADDAD